MGIVNLRQHLVRANGMVLLLPSQNASDTPARDTLINIAALASVWQYRFAHWIFEDTDMYQNVVFLGCEFGTDADLFQQRLQTLIMQLNIQNYASVYRGDEYVGVLVTSADSKENWMSPGCFLPEDWEAYFWERLLGNKQRVKRLRVADEIETVQEPQTNLAKVARQLRANELLKEWDLQ